MRERLQRFSALDSNARGIFFRAAVLLPVISLSLRVRGFRLTQQTLQNFPFFSKVEKGSLQNVPDGERVALTVRMVNAAVRHAWRASTCLEKSLALFWLLRRQGIVAELRIGARKLNGKFEAHAWVERDGTAINEPQQEHRHYATFDATFPLQSSEIS
jgi:Transglutaminase-like superfamily